jgi:AcrR family transcriptional regulator
MSTKARSPRRRRTAEEAREAILDAAERQLKERGPDSLRLQELAAEVGMSHPTLLHHFGSRDALVLAVVERALRSVEDDVVKAIAETPTQPPEQDASDVEGMLERVAAALDGRGHGRTIAWLSLSGQLPPSEDVGIHMAAEATHAIRRGRRGAHTPPFEDTQYTLMLAYYALFAQAVVGALVARSAGVADDARTRARFRRWLARLISTHLQSGGRP